MENIEKQREIDVLNEVECDESTITDKPDVSDSSAQNKASNSFRPAFICTSILTIMLPILWFIVTGMVSGSGNGYDNLWWVRLLGGDSVADISNGQGIAVLISFGWTFGLFLVFFIQGNNILRAIYGDVIIRAKRWGCCVSKMEPKGVDERTFGILIGSLFCFSNLCFIMCISFAWPALEKSPNWKSILSEKLTIPLANLLWGVWSLIFTFMFSAVPNKRTWVTTTRSNTTIKFSNV